MNYFVALLVALALAAIYLIRRSSRAKSPPHPSAAAPKPPIAAQESPLLAGLRQNLRLKVGYDEEKIDRLIQNERERLGNLPLQTLMAAAIERWERDNR
jgi:hypothetical protein